MITLKIKYNTSQENSSIIKEYQRQYTICYKVIYKYLKQGLSNKEIKEKLKLYKNIDLILNNSWFLNCLFYDVKCILNENNVCFNKNLILKRIKHLILKEEFQQKKFFKLCSNGEKDKRCNRFFKFKNINTILFKPNRKICIELNLQSLGKNRIKILNKLISAQELNNELPITYKLDNNYIYISFNENYLKENTIYTFKENRIFSIDLNPNFIGYSIIDWKNSEKLDYKLIDKGVISLKSLNDIFFLMKNKSISSNDSRKIKLNNKRKFEVYEISKYLVKLAKHYKCEFFALEDLSITSCDKQQGKKFNSLCNNIWNRNKLENNLQKRCNIYRIKFQKVIANWSSVLGNSLYRDTKLPDMILSSIEISRRCQEFNLQYLKKQKEKQKNIIFPSLTEKVRNLLIQTMEVLNSKFQFDKVSEFCYSLKKNLGNKYRVPLDISRVFRQNHLKYQLILFNEF